MPAAREMRVNGSMVALSIAAGTGSAALFLWLENLLVPHSPPRRYRCTLAVPLDRTSRKNPIPWPKSARLQLCVPAREHKAQSVRHG